MKNYCIAGIASSVDDRVDLGFWVKIQFLSKSQLLHIGTYPVLHGISNSKIVLRGFSGQVRAPGSVIWPAGWNVLS